MGQTKNPPCIQVWSQFILYWPTSKKQVKQLEDAHLIPESLYAPHGGCFPVIVKGVGVVGTIRVSGLAQEDDHKLSVRAIRKYLKNENCYGIKCMDRSDIGDALIRIGEGMLKNKLESKMFKTRCQPVMFLIMVALMISSCQPARVASTPTLPSKIESQPIPGGPVLSWEGISLRNVANADDGSIKLALHPHTGNIYILNPASGLSILKLDQSKNLEKVANPADIIEDAMLSGMVFGPDGTLYVVANRTVENIYNQAIIRKGVADADGNFQWKTLAQTEPYPLSNTYYDHLYNGVVVSPDGQWVYLNAGSRTEHGEVEDNAGAFPNTRDVALTSRILRLPTSAAELVLPNDEAALTAQGLIFARGTRNAYDMAFAPNGDLFAVDNGPDADYPDELNWIREGLHYGFPWRFGTQDNPQRLANYDPTKDLLLQSGFYSTDNGLYHNDPSFPQPPSAFTDPVVNLGPDAMQYRGDDGQEYDSYAQGKSLSTFTPHRSPLGLVFATDSKLPAQWRSEGDTLSVFILSWGAAGGTLSDKGQDLLHMQLTKTGDNYEAITTQIARGFQNPIDAVLIKNRLYVLEYGGNGAIWELTFE